MTVAPLDNPTKNPTNSWISVPVPPPTADRASFPTKRPTITASAALYNCWKKVPNKIGKKNRSSCCQMTPVTILFSFPITFSVCSCVISVFASILICPLKIYTSTMIVSFPQNLFKRAILSTSKGRKNPGWWKHPGSLSAPG